MIRPPPPKVEARSCDSGSVRPSSGSSPPSEQSLADSDTRLAVPFLGRVHSLLVPGAEARKQRHDPDDELDAWSVATGNLLSRHAAFGCRYLRAIRAAVAGEAADASTTVDMVMFGDFGRDLDKEKALCVAIALQRIGAVGQITAVANGSDAATRARLAAGTAQVLNAACTVAVGSSTALDQEAFSYEFAHCDYLGREEQLESQGGHEAVFAAIQRARLASRKVCIVLVSGLTDMAAVMRDARWPEARASVSCVTAMGGAIPLPAAEQPGKFRMDPAASNNHYDLRSAEEVYGGLQADPGGPPFYVVSRFAAVQCRLERLAFQGSLHPVAQRLQHVGQDIVQNMWMRVHRSQLERLKVNDRMPMRCNVDWFRKHFFCADAPRDLRATDRIWDYVKDLGESCSDGLAVLVAALASKPAVLQELFSPQQSAGDNLSVIGADSVRHGVRDPQEVSHLLHELMIMVIGGGDGAWLRQASEVAGARDPVDLVIVGDYGKDLDDETALCVASTMRQVGLIGEMSVVANLGDSAMRARLAKGTLQALHLNDVPVAAGTHGGQPGEELYAHEFMHCDYLATSASVDARGGHELIFEALQASRRRVHLVCIVLGSSLTDMAAVIDDPRWSQAKSIVTCVAAMGGAKVEGDEFVIDPSAANNAFDLTSAEKVYSALQRDHSLQFVVVSRFAAACCQMPRGALDGSLHPVAQRFVAVSEPGLQKLWERSHRSVEERQALRDALPARCNEAWFRSSFLMPHAPEELGPRDQIWKFVKGFNEYDALTLIAGVCAAHPPLFDEFFCPVQCPKTNMTVVGIDAARHGVSRPNRASELLHDCLVQAFCGRLKAGMQVEVKGDDGDWSTFRLVSQKRQKGLDVWSALGARSSSFAEEVTLAGPLEGESWRLKVQNEAEPILVDPATSYMYREVNGMKWAMFQTHSAWLGLRQRFHPRRGDVFLCGPIGCGRSPVQVACLALRGSQRLDDVDMSKPYMLEMAVSRDRFTPNEIDDHFAPEERVFKTFMPRPSLPCKPWHGWLPQGLKVVVVVRDPRDMCAHLFEQVKRGGFCRDSEKWTWQNCLDLYCSGEFPCHGDWFKSYMDWWKCYLSCPSQVLWLVFEDMLRRPCDAVRQLGQFLGVATSDASVAHIAEIFEFDEIKRRFGTDLDFNLREGKVGVHERYFSADEYARFRQETLAPALASGMQLSPECDTDPVLAI